MFSSRAEEFIEWVVADLTESSELDQKDQRSTNLALRAIGFSIAALAYELGEVCDSINDLVASVHKGD